MPSNAAVLLHQTGLSLRLHVPSPIEPTLCGRSSRSVFFLEWPLCCQPALQSKPSEYKALLLSSGSRIGALGGVLECQDTLLNYHSCFKKEGREGGFKV